ncbi:MAG: ABC transporter permease subunit, partial [Anaerolineae bacterium]|nr:ABC transporter permease subunit [Anaerolineae bacterium]
MTTAIRSEAPPAPASQTGGLRTTLSNALIITRREVSDSFRDWRIMTPILIMTLAFPALSQFGANLMVNFVTQYGAELIGERTIPFLLMIVGFFPVSLSLVIALETFVGEKERRSLEPLLSTPLTNLELYIGKMLAAMIPPLVASIFGMIVYLTGLLFGELAWRPQPMLVVQVMALTSAHALLMVTGAVVVSSNTTSTRAANLLASFIIVPVSLLVILESIIMFGAPDAESPNGIFALWVIIVGLLIGTALFVRIGTRIFNREELLNSSMDALNLRWIGRTFWRNVRGAGRPGLVGWYRQEVFPALRHLGAPTMLLLVCSVAAFAGGWVIGNVTDLQIPPDVGADSAMLTENFGTWFELGS